MKFFRDRLCISLFKKKSLFPALLTHFKLNENALADVVRVSIAGGDKHDYINSFIKDSHSPRSYESRKAMKLLFLGTGAADWDWTHFTEETRGSTSTLVNRHLLIDAGTSARQNFQRAGISPECIHDILITHSHSDHFSPESICSLAAESCKKPHLYASAQALQQIPDGLYSKHPLSIGEKLRIGTCEITVLRANHALKDPSEPAFHFLFDTPGKRMLYALDGAWMCSDACRMLAGRVIDLIVWDATCGNTFDDWRFADHNDLAMIRSMQNSMQKLGIIAPGTIHLFDHIARSLWPEQKQERFQLAEQFSGMLAFDGMELSLE